MINFRTSRKNFIVHSGSQSPSKFQNISKNPSALLSTFMETHSKSFKSFSKTFIFDAHDNKAPFVLRFNVLF